MSSNAVGTIMHIPAALTTPPGWLAQSNRQWQWLETGCIRHHPPGRRPATPERQGAPQSVELLQRLLYFTSVLNSGMLCVAKNSQLPESLGYAPASGCWRYSIKW
ncbi:hypothetical protein E2C01_022156 [Portunus trituberculatus]|uniref:Uncharacterized protein n=1 Tax=Portunus trituberculatus TaxID=210409 RepID=A0A5B7E4M1_PORTR|nr:hypothetical protein [Portunus trituberculatus]